MTQKPLIACSTYPKMEVKGRPFGVYGLRPTYIDAVRKAGGLPILVPASIVGDDLEAILARVDGILLPGGGDIAPELYQQKALDNVYGVDEERDLLEIKMAQFAVAENLPIFAICRGIQVFNVALGGTLWQDIPSQLELKFKHGNFNGVERNHLAHLVRVNAGTRLAKLLGKTETLVNSFHHQALKEVAPQLTVTAYSQDDIIEGVEIADHRFAVGVQWHPENLVDDDPAMLALFEGLVEAARGS